MKTIPDEGTPVFKDSKELCDDNKRVVVNSVGGALVKAKGTVIIGPRIFSFKAHTKKGATKGRDGKIGMKEVIITTDPYWCVQLENGRCIYFSKSELTFV